MWRLDALGCAVVGAAAGVALVVGAVLHIEHRTSVSARSATYSTEIPFEPAEAAL